MSDIPKGFVEEDLIIHGKRKSHPGLYEIKFHNPKKKNAIGTPPEKKLGELIAKCQDDEEVKVILLHGGTFFSSGNDISIFTKVTDKEAAKKRAENSVNIVMVNFLLQMANSKKPIVAVVRGRAIGIGFTLLSHATLVYVDPKATFYTPFMASGQSPEGTSSLMFP